MRTVKQLASGQSMAIRLFSWVFLFSNQQYLDTASYQMAGGTKVMMSVPFAPAPAN
ncbi:hypothetical protein ACFL6E_06850 [Candidatus Neomarinimicrobiota bacterium]